MDAKVKKTTTARMVRIFIKKNLQQILWLLMVPFLIGCGKTDDEYLIEAHYVHHYPEKSASKKTPTYITTPYNEHASDSHKTLFDGYVLVGKASFINRPVAPTACIKFGKKVGADAVLLSFKNKKEITKYARIAVPDKRISTTTQESTNILGAIGDTLVDKLLDSRRERITITPQNREQSRIIYKYIDQPYTEIHYEQSLLFLKRTNTLKAPWEYTIKDFIGQQKQEESPYVGDWVHHEIGKLTLLSTETEYVAFISRDKKYKNKEKCKVNKKLKWRNGDIKLRINKSNKQGWYINRDKMPIAIYVIRNQSNQLEIRVLQTDKVLITLHSKQ